MKFLLFSDLHLRLNDPLGSPTSDGLTTRIHKKIDIMKQIGFYAREYDVDFIIDLGDTFDFINPPDKLRSVYAKMMKDLEKPIIKVCGNHETDGEHAVGWDTQIFESPFLKIINKPTFKTLTSTKYNSNSATYDSFDCVFIPEVKNEEIIEFLEREEYKDKTVFGHFGIVGVKYPSGTIGEGGVPMSTMKQRSAPSFIGHIHLGQELTSDIHYIGAVARHDFGDRNITPRCCLIDTSGEELQITYFPVNDIDLIHIDVTQVAPDVSEMKDLSDSIVKLVYTGTRQWFDSQNVTLLKQQLYGKGCQKVFVNFNVIIDDKEFVETAESLDAIELVIKKSNEDKKSEEHKQFGLSIIQSVLEEEENE